MQMLRRFEKKTKIIFFLADVAAAAFATAIFVSSETTPHMASEVQARLSSVLTSFGNCNAAAAVVADNERTRTLPVWRR